MATSNLTFFRQIGGSVALAIVGTIFGSTFLEQVGPQLSASGVPAQVVAGFGQATATGAIDFNQLTGVGDIGAAILAGIPEAFRGAVEPFIPQIVDGIQQAFSLGIAQTFWIGVAATVIAVIAAAFMIEHPLRADDRHAVPARADAEGGPALRPTGSPAD